VQLKKHLAWYSDGLPFAARSRPAIFAARTPSRSTTCSGGSGDRPALVRRLRGRGPVREPSKTLTDAHFMFFAGMTGDAHPIHYDDEYAKKTRYGAGSPRSC